MTGVRLLTIGIPAYNEEKFLAKTLDSILQQTFGNFIVYLCDGGSTDDTLKIAKKYEYLDKRIKVFHSIRKLNFVENWRWPLTQCKTEYFCWVGAHDLLHPDYFKDALAIFESNPAATLVYPLSMEIDIEDIILDHSDSDIDTHGLTNSSAVLKIAKELNSCTAIHGIFRSANLKRLSIKRILAFDFLLLLLISLYGDIRKTQSLLFYRRAVRVEDINEAIKRYRATGMFESTKYHHYEVLVKNCLFGYLRHSKADPLSKATTFLKLASILRKKFSLTRAGLIKCVLNI